MKLGRESAPLVLWRIMHDEGCNEWERTAGGGAVIRFRAGDGETAYARLVRADELADTVANRVAGDVREWV